MQIHYCDKCKARIPESDVAMGLAFVSRQGNLYCPFCWQQLLEQGRRTAESSTVLPAVEPKEAEPEFDEAAAPTRQMEAAQRTRLPPPPTRPGSRIGLRRDSRRAGRTQRTAAIGRVTPPLRRRRRSWGMVVGLAAGMLAAAVIVPLYLAKMKRRQRADIESSRAAEEKEPDSATATPSDEAESQPESQPGSEPEERVELVGGPEDEPVEQKQPTLEEVAREKFDEIRTLVEAGKLAEADRIFEEDRADLVVVPEYLSKTEELLLDAKVKQAVAEAEGLAAAGKYAEALSLVDKTLKLNEAIGSRHVDTLGKLLKRLRRDEEEAAAKRRAEEAERRKREKWDELMVSAKRKAADGEFKAALESLAEAQAIFDTEELRDEIIRITFDMHVHTGRGHLEVGRIGEAIAAFENALEVKEDAGLEREVARLRNLKEFNDLCALAERLAARRERDTAIETYRKAKKLAPDDESRERLDSAVLELQFAAALADAERNLRARRWKKAEASALRALELKRDSARARAALTKARKGLVPRELSDSAGIDLVLVPEGAFTMGANDGPRDVRPAHKVNLDAYYIGVTEITNRQYELFASTHKKLRGKHAPDDDHPVTNVTYEDAVRFCKWLSRENNATYRLPTEAEWERAARGSDGRMYPWGDERPATRGTYRCNFGMRARKGWGRDGFILAAPVGSFPDWPSAAGCLDMAGNVAEWCQDWYATGYELARKGNPGGPSTGKERVIRGGFWKSAAPGVTATTRSFLAPGTRAVTVGFRVVREVGTIPSADGS